MAEMKTAVSKRKSEQNAPRTSVHFQESFEEYKRIYHQTTHLSSVRDFDDIFKHIERILGKIIPFSALAMLFKEPDKEDFYLQNETGLNKKLHKAMRWLESSGHLKWVCDANIVSTVPQDDSPNKENPVIVIPLYAADRVIGALVVFMKIDPEDISMQKTDLLFLLGTQAAISLEKIRLYREMAVKNHALSSIRTFLENAVQSISDGLFALDLEGKVSLFNTSMEKLTGFTQTQAVGSKYEDLFDREMVVIIDRISDKTLISGQGHDECLIENLVRKKRVPLEIRASVLRDYSGKPIGVIFACSDTSARKELIHLRKLDQLKDEFLSSVSHELRTPLTAIKSFTEILQDTDSRNTGLQKEFLQVIGKETDRLISMIEDLLDLDRLAQEDIDPQLDHADLKMAYEESLNSVKTLAEKKSIEIINKFRSGPLIVRGNQTRLAQLFVNLIGNAIKFSPEKSKIQVVSDRIITRNNDVEQSHIKIGIADEGIGVPPELKSVIFEKFKQLRPEPSTKPEGSGLGLWICKQIVDRHGGTLWVESRESGGCIFYFTIPEIETD